MPAVIGTRARGQIASLDFDSASNVVLAWKLSGAINAGVPIGTIPRAVDSDGPLLTVPGGEIAEQVQTHNGTMILPPGYISVVGKAADSTGFGSGDT